MSGQVKRILIAIVGVFFLIIGLIGLALPFLQGFLFLFIGIVLLSLISSRIRGWMEVHTRKYPKLHRFMEKTEHWVTRVIGPTDRV